MLSSKGAQDVFCQTNESLGDIFDCSYAVLKKRLASKNLKEKFKTFFHRKESLANASVSCIKGEYTEKLEGGCEKAMRNYMFIIRKPLRLSICDGKNKAKNVINCVTKKFKASGKLMRQNKELKRVLQECTRKKSSV
jgi:predicted nucleotidyltransferase